MADRAWDGDRDYRRYLALRSRRERGELTREERVEYEALGRAFTTFLLAGLRGR